ncbi:MAG: helix-turn-helix domain-containing protein [Natrialbaceae archaeon]|nr:helix-turn-helix domain-containing protein [Natrialbaceae archaeon]
MWFSDVGRASLEQALERDATIDRYEYLSAVEDQLLYSVGFSGNDHIFAIVVATGGTVLTATAGDGRWTLQVRAPQRDAMSQIYDRLDARDMTVDIVRLCNLADESADALGLTEQQYTAIVKAIEHGYFEIPRETSLEDLAEELGISHQALSERLRRAYQTLATKELHSIDQESTSALQASLR